MMSAKMASADLGFLKIQVFRNKDYDIIILLHKIINKILSSDSNFIVDVIM